MKPGLRKIAALILASATLFGGGVLSASTAYADDTTLDTSTQLQAEPDTQTTMGGDVSETTPDNGSDNEAGTDTDNQSDDTTPQTNADQAAPDVTIHDMLDTDSATVSKLKLTGWTTGTAPFDKDNERGDDNGPNNNIVRSFDTVTYDYDYTVTPDSTMDYYKRTRVGFRFELPYPSNKVAFATDQMQWVDRTPGYEPKLTTETINGTPAQVYTCYRLLEPTSQTPTVNPGTSAISLAVAVKAAPHSYKFHPTVKAWTVWDKTNPTNTGTHKQVEDSPKDVTVSAKLALNVSMKFTVQGTSTYDFNTGDATAPNKGRGKVKGRQLHVQVMTSMRWPNRAKGLKGIEAPSGNIGYRLNVSNVFKDDDDKHTKHKGEKQWQPILWDRNWGYNGRLSEHGRVKDGFDHGTWYPYSATTVGYDSVLNGHASYDAGKTSADGTSMNVSFTGYDTLKYPCSDQGVYYRDGKCPTDYMDGTLTKQQVAPLHVDEFTFILPTSTTDGKTAAQYYRKDQIGNITITDTNLTATGTSGTTLNMSDTNTNQTVTNDDTVSGNWNVRLPGRLIQTLYYTSYASPRSGYVSEPTTGRWTDAERAQGSDRVLAGQSIGVMSSATNNLDSIAHGRVIGYHLIKWNPTILTPLAAENNPTQPYKVAIGYCTWGIRFNWSDTVDSDAQTPVMWGVRPDGGKLRQRHGAGEGVLRGFQLV